MLSTTDANSWKQLPPATRELAIRYLRTFPEELQSGSPTTGCAKLGNEINSIFRDITVHAQMLKICVEDPRLQRDITAILDAIARGRGLIHDTCTHSMP